MEKRKLIILLKSRYPGPCCHQDQESWSIIRPIASSYTKYAALINQATSYNYPVPEQDNGNMSDVPDHLQDPEGPSLDWLKNL